MHRRRGLRAARPGFSIVELMVGMMIISVLTVLAYPSISRQMRTTKLEAAAYTVSTDVEMAFSLAARQRRPVTLSVDGANRRYMIRDRSTATIMLDRYMSDKDSPYGLTGLSMSTSAVTIFPNGLASQPTSIQLTLAGQTRTVTLTRTGLVRIVGS